MIKATKDFNDIPDGLKTPGAEKKREELLRDGSEHDFSSHFYSHDSVKKTLRHIYRDKCAYCECKVDAGAFLQVDHFRPKRSVKEDDGHGGYYWLAYEWSNLILCCPKCNGEKSTHFPVRGRRVAPPQTDLARTDRMQWRADSKNFIDEDPLLLHPEIDQPEEHFEFLRDGTICPKTERGRATVGICGLDRESLNIQRKNRIDRFKSAIWDQVDILFCDQQKKGGSRLSSRDAFFHDLELGFDTLFKSLMNAEKPDCEYSCLGRHMIQKFYEFFVEKLPSEEQRQMVMAAFKQFEKKR